MAKNLILTSNLYVKIVEVFSLVHYITIKDFCYTTIMKKNIECAKEARRKFLIAQRRNHKRAPLYYATNVTNPIVIPQYSITDVCENNNTG